MSKRSRKHKWDVDQCPVLKDHSKAKHAILSEYIQKYLTIVCQSRKIQQYNITLVDGFAGGDIYQEDKKGSPSVMIDAVSEAIDNINRERTPSVEIDPHYFFIEKDKRNYSRLENVIKDIELDNDRIILKNGDFNSYINEIVEHIKKRNKNGGGGSIFFLDQDGYSSVSVETLNFIRKELPKAEIIININVSWLIDFISDLNQLKNTVSKMGITKFIDLNEIIDLKANIGEHRYIIEAKLSTALQQAADFPYFRPFFIEPHDNHRGYWLLHLAPHYRAHNAMSEVIWDQGNYMRHYGGDGARIFDLSYKGGIIDIPDIFGNTFNGTAREKHINGLIRDLPRIIWERELFSFSELIEHTCNNTAASKDMYSQSLLEAKRLGEILIRGKAGGKKKSDIIMPSDIIIPNRQRCLFDMKPRTGTSK
ncbi:MAG: three-Cys-motif partner protein TcmP [Candidatus Electrothrix sp. EH2]|nr:three-Cys-motif partner protein TcmP [Candidatus Electrothrix sp. EH2]